MTRRMTSRIRPRKTRLRRLQLFDDARENVLRNRHLVDEPLVLGYAPRHVLARSSPSCGGLGDLPNLIDLVEHCFALALKSCALRAQLAEDFRAFVLTEHPRNVAGADRQLALEAT